MQARIDAYLATASAADKAYFARFPQNFPTLKNSPHSERTARALGGQVKAGYSRSVSMARDLSRERRADLVNLRRELLNETRWHASDGALAVGVIAGSIGAVCDLLLDIVPERNPIHGSLETFYETIKITLMRGEMPTWSDLRNPIFGALAWSMLEDMVDGGAAAVTLIKAFSNFGASLRDVLESGRDQRELRQEIERQLARIDRELVNYDEQIRRHPMLDGMRDRIEGMRTEYLQVHEHYRQFLNTFSQGEKSSAGAGSPYMVPDLRLGAGLAGAIGVVALLVAIRRRRARR